MKIWIVKQWIALAEVFAWEVPNWVRGLVTEEEYTALVSRETSLTESLKTGSPPEHEMPAFLQAKIERGILNAPTEGKWLPGWKGILIPASAFATVLALAFVIVSMPGSRTGSIAPQPVPGEVVDGSPEVAVVERFAAQMTKIDSNVLREQLLLRPLASEQARLTADVTNALRFVANSVLPDEYARNVSMRLTSLEEEVGKSI